MLVLGQPLPRLLVFKKTALFPCWATDHHLVLNMTSKKQVAHCSEASHIAEDDATKDSGATPRRG